ncbi:replication factor A protein 3 [Limtongia smithiae]|uniref:replication factor A protein 3 n=1 Tax=Limtongia smithiae TaxID=1125753 RepID=UPI0034CDA3B0
MPADSTPRVNATHLHIYPNQTVRLVGKVMEINGDVAVLDAKGTVRVFVPSDNTMAIGHAFEVTGKVQPDLTIRMLDGTDFGTGLNMDNANTLADLVQRFPDIFFSK